MTDRDDLRGPGYSHVSMPVPSLGDRLGKNPVHVDIKEPLRTSIDQSVTRAVSSLTDQHNRLQDTVNKRFGQIDADFRTQVDMLKQMLDAMRHENERLTKESERLTEDNTRLRDELREARK